MNFDRTFVVAVHEIVRHTLVVDRLNQTNYLIFSQEFGCVLYVFLITGPVLLSW